MPAPTTAEKQSPNRNQSLWEDSAVLDTQEKESGVEQENTNNQSVNADSLTPNPTDGFSMAGNASASPVAAEPFTSGSLS